MMKKILFLLIAIAVATGASAQFERGKTYVGASLSGLDLNWSEKTKMAIGLAAMGGYMVWDNIMLNANLAINANTDDAGNNQYSFGVGGRDYFVSNGIFVGANVSYYHVQKKYNDVMPTVEAGWAFFVNRTITIEPAVYFRPSFMRSERNRIGLKIGIGLNLETNKKNETIFTM